MSEECPKLVVLWLRNSLGKQSQTEYRKCPKASHTAPVWHVLTTIVTMQQDSWPVGQNHTKNDIVWHAVDCNCERANEQVYRKTAI